MLMDDPRDWQARIKSLQTAVAETIEMMNDVVDADSLLLDTTICGSPETGLSGLLFPDVLHVLFTA